MTSKEIEELREKVYEMSNGMLPLNTFFNDIRDNPNENYDKELAYEDLSIIVDYIIKTRNRLEELEEGFENANEFIFNAGQKYGKQSLELEKLKKALEEIKDNVICPYFQECESQCEDILKIINEVLDDE